MSFRATTALFGVGFNARPHTAHINRSSVYSVNVSNGMPNVVHKGILAEPRKFNKIAISSKNKLNRGKSGNRR